MRIASRLGITAALVLCLLTTVPSVMFAQETGRPEVGRDPRRGVESDEQRRNEERRREEPRASAVEEAGRKTDLTKKQNAEFHDADTLAKEVKGAETSKPAPDVPKDIESLKDTRKLSSGEIDQLQRNGVDVHDLKGNDSTLDLYRDKDGNVYVGNKDGTGAGQAIGYNTR
jgi:hypothetical protein